MAKVVVRRRTKWNIGRADIEHAVRAELFEGTTWHLVARERAGRELRYVARADLHEATLSVSVGDAIVELELAAEIPWMDPVHAREALERWLGEFDERARALYPG